MVLRAKDVAASGLCREMRRGGDANRGVNKKVKKKKQGGVMAFLGNPATSGALWVGTGSLKGAR